MENLKSAPQLLTHPDNQEFVESSTKNALDIESEYKKLNPIELVSGNKYTTAELNSECIVFECYPYPITDIHLGSITGNYKFLARFDSSDRLIEVFKVGAWFEPIELFSKRTYNKRGDLVHSVVGHPLSVFEKMGKKEFDLIDLYDNRELSKLNKLIKDSFSTHKYDLTDYTGYVGLNTGFGSSGLRAAEDRSLELYFKQELQIIQNLSQNDHRKIDFKLNFTKQKIIQLVKDYPKTVSDMWNEWDDGLDELVSEPTLKNDVFVYCDLCNKRSLPEDFIYYRGGEFYKKHEYKQEENLILCLDWAKKKESN